MPEKKYTFDEILTSLKQISVLLEEDGRYTRAWSVDIAIEMMEDMQTALQGVLEEEDFKEKIWHARDQLVKLCEGYYLPERRPDQEHLTRENTDEDNG